MTTLQYLTEQIAQCVGVSDHGDGAYAVSLADLTTRPATAAEVLLATAAERIAVVRTDARQRIEAKYPEWRQRSAALGVYPAEYVAQMQADIAAVIAASNAAEDAVAAATTVEQVEAVTATWPVI